MQAVMRKTTANFTEKAHTANCKVAVAADILSLALLTPPGEWGADIVFGTTQRLGTPMFYGGPSAGYFATRDEYKRNMPGRIIGWSKDKYGKLCYRMALRHANSISNGKKRLPISVPLRHCSLPWQEFYTVYHGQEGIRNIASRIHSITVFLEKSIGKLDYKQVNKQYFDTLRFYFARQRIGTADSHHRSEQRVNLRYFDNGDVGLSIDETTDVAAANILLSIFAIAAGKDFQKVDDIPEATIISEELKRQTPYLTHEVFSKYHTETEMMRYIKRLDRKDISLAQSMISLGSCTMKLNAAAEMLPLSCAEFMCMHPLVPEDQATGYRELINNLSEELKVITVVRLLQKNDGNRGHWTQQTESSASVSSIAIGLVFS